SIEAFEPLEFDRGCGEQIIRYAYRVHVLPNSVHNLYWVVTLLNLKGRAGLDLNLTLSYNSLVWTQENGYIQFNADSGFPAPGFKLGFPNVQQRFLNSDEGVWAYMLVTASG